MQDRRSVSERLDVDKNMDVDDIKHPVGEEVNKLRSLKLQLTVEILLEKQHTDGTTKYVKPYFRSEFEKTC